MNRLNAKACALACAVTGLAMSSASGRDIVVTPVEGDATATLQRAFDECFLAGGGTVTVEKGEYAVKGLRLRSDTTLLLKSGAVLKASRDCDDYEILENDKIEPVPESDVAPPAASGLRGVEPTVEISEVKFTTKPI